VDFLEEQAVVFEGGDDRAPALGAKVKGKVLCHRLVQ
jgi:hypothetical protein